MKTKLVHVRLEPDRIIFLLHEAKRRGISLDELVQEAVEKVYGGEPAPQYRRRTSTPAWIVAPD
jgi:hypothetical protein